MKVESTHIVDLRAIEARTGFDYKRLSNWANRDGKLEAVPTSTESPGKLFDWAAIRPVLVAEAERLGIDHSEWP